MEGMLMIIFQIIFSIVMFLSISKCETSEGSLLGFCIWISFSFLVWAIYRKGKEVTKKEKIKNIKRIKASEIYYNNYGELP